MYEGQQQNAHVLICDWEGRLQWTSRQKLYKVLGDLAWNYVVEKDREKYRVAFSRTATLKEHQQIEVDCKYGDRYRAWLWPLQWPKTAVCILVTRIPEEIASLTPRELDCLRELAVGLSAGEIADKLDVSVSTIHTLMRRARKKLHLQSLEELVSFSARYCFPKDGPLAPPAIGPIAPDASHPE